MPIKEIFTRVSSGIRNTVNSVVFIILPIISLRVLPATEANPGLLSKSLSEHAAELMDKIPTIELKVDSSGFSISTGPSTEDIYYILAWVTGSFGIILILSSLFIWCCCYKHNFSMYKNNIKTVPAITTGNPLSQAKCRLEDTKVQVGIYLN